MTWTVWDILIVLSAGMQCIALGGVAYFVLKIKAGPIARVQKQTSSLIAGGKEFAGSGKLLVSRQMPHLHGLAGHIAAVRQAILLKMLSEQAAGPITYTKIFSAFTTLRTARRGLAQAQSFRTRKTASPGLAATTATKRVTKPSLAERLGLFPPAAKPLVKAYGFVRLALQVRRELRQRHII